MTEKTLEPLSLESLLELLTKTTEELLEEIEKKENTIAINLKKSQVELIQKIIIEKRSQELPR
jgi:hypothetical protein